MIEISDNGVRLPEREIDVVKSGTETPIVHSAGIGLWITYWTVEINNENIEIKDNQPKGTTVEITLPKHKKQQK